MIQDDLVIWCTFSCLSRSQSFSGKSHNISSRWAHSWGQSFTWGGLRPIWWTSFFSNVFCRLRILGFGRQGLTAAGYTRGCGRGRNRHGCYWLIMFLLSKIANLKATSHIFIISIIIFPSKNRDFETSPHIWTHGPSIRTFLLGQGARDLAERSACSPSGWDFFFFYVSKTIVNQSRWWFQTFFIFPNSWDDDPSLHNHSCRVYIIWLVVSNMTFIFHFIYGMSPFPLTKSYFSRWLLHHQPAHY